MVTNTKETFMKPYKNKSGNSGVVAYEAGDDFMIIQFATGAIYKYSDSITGKRNIRKMKTLAALGKGLSTFIATDIKDLFEQKLS